MQLISEFRCFQLTCEKVGNVPDASANGLFTLQQWRTKWSNASARPEETALRVFPSSSLVPFYFLFFFFIATVITEPPARSTHDLTGALLSLFGGLNLLSVDEKYDEAEEGKKRM